MLPRKFFHFLYFPSPSNQKVMEIPLISLRSPSSCLGTNTFMVIRSNSHRKDSTGLNQDGRSYPQWNNKSRLEFLPLAQSIFMEMHCKTWQDIKRVGAASILILNFHVEYLPNGYFFLLELSAEGKEKCNEKVNHSD